MNLVSQISMSRAIFMMQLQQCQFCFVSKREYVVDKNILLCGRARDDIYNRCV